MAQGQTKAQLRQEFISRVKRAREARLLSQEGISVLLGIAQDKYKWYETKRFMPHEYVSKFCLACGIDEHWLFTGLGKAPAMPKPESVAPKRAKARAKSKAA